MSTIYSRQVEERLKAIDKDIELRQYSKTRFAAFYKDQQLSLFSHSPSGARTLENEIARFKSAWKVIQTQKDKARFEQFLHMMVHQGRELVETHGKRVRYSMEIYDQANQLGSKPIAIPSTIAHMIIELPDIYSLNTVDGSKTIYSWHAHKEIPQEIPQENPLELRIMDLRVKLDEHKAQAQALYQEMEDILNELWNRGGEGK